eukprot:1446573-Prorocentrum_lima.AAC.1
MLGHEGLRRGTEVVTIAASAELLQARPCWSRIGLSKISISWLVWEGMILVGVHIGGGCNWNGVCVA